ncbi:MAG: lipid-A-disaccharide synthase [Gemmataceae bacterium]|nr:lipid-A-disaccharide synthase [Gemmataceae bacterium]
MRFFISAGEPSGDLHAGNLATSLRQDAPHCDIYGLGGPRLRAAGVDLLYPLAEHAVMGFIAVAGVVPALADLLERITDAWYRRRPDAVVLIDYPGYHWWVAARAKALDIPVVSFVPPQLWAWAGHRVRKMRRTFDKVLCALPFEQEWFASRGLDTEYIGHPYFDELAKHLPDATFVSRARSGGPVIGMLPGSRQGEVKHNTDWLIDSARTIHRDRPDARFLFACYRESHRDAIAARLESESFPAEAHVHRTADVIASSDACIAVSGSVGLELLWHGKPSAVIYKTNRTGRVLFNLLRTTNYISLVNLLAGRELFPEILTSEPLHPAPAQHVLRWLSDPGEHSRVVNELRDLKQAVGMPGACDRAARYLVSLASHSARQAA